MICAVVWCPKMSASRWARKLFSSNVLDPLAWHLAVMLIASGIGVGLSKGIYAAIGLDLPNYLMAFFDRDRDVPRFPKSRRR